MKDNTYLVENSKAGSDKHMVKGDENLICLADVETRPIAWLWHPYMAKGKLTLAEGDPGVGKSYFTMALAAAVSRGLALPGSKPLEPGQVLVFSAEDDPADTLKPRLEKLGAEMSHIFIYPKPLEFDESGLQLVERYISEKRPTLVVVDPIQSFMGKKDMNRANETRSVLAPLGEISNKYGVATLVVRHLKKSHDKSTYRGMGSIDILAAVRSVLLIGCDSKDKDQRAVVHIKSNLAPFGKTLGYRIDEGAFSWTGESGLTAADLLGNDLEEGGEPAVQEAVSFLEETLRSGRVLAKEIQRSVRDLGLSTRTVNRAKKLLGVSSHKIRDQWFWYLPAHATKQDCQESHMENLAMLPDVRVGTL